MAEGVLSDRPEIILMEAVQLGYSLTYDQALDLASRLSADEATDPTRLDAEIQRLGLKKAS